MTGIRQTVERVFREESGGILATLIRVLDDFDLAEEALQEAFAAALDAWSTEGVPDRPGAWITTAARRKAVDIVRRERRRGSTRAELDEERKGKGDEVRELEERLDSSLPDDPLRLIFTCCHPALDEEARVALTLRTLGGLTTGEIASAFLIPRATLGQRIVRAKRKIKEAGIPYRVPPDHLLHERLPAVLAVIYLVFNEGYSASTGDELIRQELCADAIRLARVLAALMPDEPEVLGLLALLVLQDSRRAARVSPEGDLVRLEEQDRNLWDRERIREGRETLERLWTLRRPGSYGLQASIAWEHARAASAQATDWKRIAALYDELADLHASPVVALNRAVAVAMAEGPARGLELVEEANRDGALDGYLFFHTARADLMQRLERRAEAEVAYGRALELAGNRAERRFLQRRLRELRSS